MKKKTSLWAAAALLVAFCAALASCEKAYSDQAQPERPRDGQANVLLRVATLQQMPFAGQVEGRSLQPVSSLCSRLSFVVFSGDEKLKSISQKAGDADFGTASLSLAEGTYDVVVIAHSGDGAATVTSASKITFPSNVVTDMFYYYGQLSVGSQPQTHELELRRAVSMFRFVTTDNVPAGVRKMRFYYTGGSSTFDATTGYGSVNSRQTVNFAITDEMTGKPLQLDVYTCLHADAGNVKMTVSALDANDQVVREQTIEEVPMQRNIITQYTGTFFTSGSLQAEQSFGFKADAAWGGTVNL